MFTCWEIPFGEIFACVRLSTGLWIGVMGSFGSGMALGHGVDQHAHVQWAIGSFVYSSARFLVSVGGMSTLGYASVSCMNCTLGGFTGEYGR